MNRRSAIKHVVGAIGSLKLLETGGEAAPQSLEDAYRIQSSNITAYINKQGEIAGLTLSRGREKHLINKVLGQTVLAGCTLSKVTARKLSGGGVEFKKQLIHGGDGQSCQLTERFSPGKFGSIRWEIEIL